METETPMTKAMPVTHWDYDTDRPVLQSRWQRVHPTNSEPDGTEPVTVIDYDAEPGTIIIEGGTVNKLMYRPDYHDIPCFIPHIEPEAIDVGDGQMLVRRDDMDDEQWSLLKQGFANDAPLPARSLAAWLIQERTGRASVAERLELAADRHRSEVERLNNSLAGHRRQMRCVADALLEEARRRDWCDEYNDFVDTVNSAAGAEVLRRDEQEFVVRYVVSVTVTASNRDQATEQANEAVEAGDGVGDIDYYEVEYDSCEAQ